MGASFGEDLKRERELRDISLQEISEATKISIRFLQAIEENKFEVLPGGIFNAGFIRAYSTYIGVDDDEMVNNYLYYLQQNEENEEEGERKQKARQGTKGWWRWVLLAAVLVVAIAVLVWLLFFYLSVFDSSTESSFHLPGEIEHPTTRAGAEAAGRALTEYSALPGEFFS